LFTFSRGSYINKLLYSQKLFERYPARIAEFRSSLKTDCEDHYYDLADKALYLAKAAGRGRVSWMVG